MCSLHVCMAGEGEREEGRSSKSHLRFKASSFSLTSCCICMSGSVWRSEYSCVELVLSTNLYAGSGDQTWVGRLVEQALICLAISLALKTSS